MKELLQYVEPSKLVETDMEEAVTGLRKSLQVCDELDQPRICVPQRPSICRQLRCVPARTSSQSCQHTVNFGGVIANGPQLSKSAVS